MDQRVLHRSLSMGFLLWYGSFTLEGPSRLKSGWKIETARRSPLKMYGTARKSLWLYVRLTGIMELI